jgi:hypothetical protein
MGDRSEVRDDSKRESGGSQSGEAQRGQREGGSSGGDRGAKADAGSDRPGGAGPKTDGTAAQPGQRDGVSTSKSDGGGGMSSKDAASVMGKSPDHSDGPAKKSDGGGGMTSKDATSVAGKTADRSDATTTATRSGKGADAPATGKTGDAPHGDKKTDAGTKPADAGQHVKSDAKTSTDPIKDGLGPREPALTDKEMLDLYDKIANDIYFMPDRDFQSKYGYSKAEVQEGFKGVFERRAKAEADIARQPGIGPDRHYQAEQQLKAFNEALDAMRKSALAGVTGGVQALRTPNDMRAIRDAAVAGKNLGDLAGGVAKAGTPPASNQGPPRSVEGRSGASVESAQGPTQGGTKGETRSK